MYRLGCTRRALSSATWLLLGFVVFSLHQIPVAVAQVETSAFKIYRGSIGDKSIEMRLRVGGNTLVGSYSYDQIRQEIKLSGGHNSQGVLELNEDGARNRKAGKFVCKPEPETFAADLECELYRPDGSSKAYVVLYEQYLAFRNGINIVPRVIADREAHVTASYPQLTVAQGATNSAVNDFNRLITSLVEKAIKEFAPQPAPGRTSFTMNYNVMLGTDEVVSIEMNEYSDSGGAHPNTRLWTFNYDISASKQLVLDDLFQPKVEYKPAIAEYVVQDINKRAEQIEQAQARRSGRAAEKRDEPIITEERLPEIYAWGMTPKGIAIYFDFPRVLALFDKTLVPYSVVRGYLRSDGPTARFIR